METPSAAVPSPETATAEVVGVHPEDAPMHISRTYTRKPPVSGRLGTRFVALDTKATYRPPALIVLPKLSAFAGLPSPAAETIVLEGEQLVGWPRQESKSHMSLSLALKMTKRPSGLSTGGTSSTSSVIWPVWAIASELGV